MLVVYLKNFCLFLAVVGNTGNCLKLCRYIFIPLLIYNSLIMIKWVHSSTTKNKRIYNSTWICMHNFYWCGLLFVNFYMFYSTLMEPYYFQLHRNFIWIGIPPSPLLSILITIISWNVYTSQSGLSTVPPLGWAGSLIEYIKPAYTYTWNNILYHL